MRSIRTIRGTPPEKIRRKSSTMLVSAASGLWRDYKQKSKSEKPRHVTALEIVRVLCCSIVSYNKIPFFKFRHEIKAGSHRNNSNLSYLKEQEEIAPRNGENQQSRTIHRPRKHLESCFVIVNVERTRLR